MLRDFEIHQAALRLPVDHLNVYVRFLDEFGKHSDSDNIFQICNRVDGLLDLPDHMTLKVLRKVHPII